MPIGNFTRYDKTQRLLTSASYLNWDDATVGAYMWALAKNTYTPAATNQTLADVGTADVDWIATGDGAPINATTRTIDDTTTPGTTYYQADDANFGAAVTVTAKYLLCIQPVTPGTAASTSLLVGYVDLDTTDGSASKSSTGSDFSINQPTNGWIHIEDAP